MTILHALALFMAAGALFACAYLSSLRPPAGRAYPGALRRLLAKRGGFGFLSVTGPPRSGVGSAGRAIAARRSPLTAGEGECGHGLTHRAPSPVFLLAAARYGAGPSYAAGLNALRRVTDRVALSETGASHQQPVASRPHAAGLRPHP